MTQRHSLYPSLDAAGAYTHALESFDFTPLAEALQDELAIVGQLSRFPAGSLPVFALGDQSVLKMFPPDDLAAAATEWNALRALASSGFTPLPIQQHSEHGWAFILMSRLEGVGLDTRWEEIGAAQRHTLANQTGQRLRHLHDLTTVHTGPDVARWHEWKHAQLATLVATQRRLGLAEHWCTQLVPFIESALGGGPPRGVALLHTEVMPAHLTVSTQSEGPSLLGLCDFEPAMFADVDYEFASVGAFMACGDSAVLTAVLHGWGIPPDERDQRLSQRLLAMLLLHRYCHLPKYLERLPQAEAPTLAAVADAWFGLQ